LHPRHLILEACQALPWGISVILPMAHRVTRCRLKSCRERRDKPKQPTKHSRNLLKHLLLSHLHHEYLPNPLERSPGEIPGASILRVLPLQKMVTTLSKAFKMEPDGGVAPGVGHPVFPEDVSTPKCRLRLFISPGGVDWNEAGRTRSVAMHVDGTRGRAGSRDHSKRGLTLKRGLTFIFLRFRGVSFLDFCVRRMQKSPRTDPQGFQEVGRERKIPKSKIRPQGVSCQLRRGKRGLTFIFLCFREAKIQKVKV